MAAKIVAGNWKMNGNKASIEALLSSLRNGLDFDNVNVVLFAPFVYLPLLQQQLEGADIAYGAQTVSEYSSGAYTGEVAAAMLTDFGCRYVLVGHSERRSIYKESNKDVAAKFMQAQSAALLPMLCVGETLTERESNQTLNVIKSQLQAVIDAAGIEAFANAVIAYEPVWAIGTGKTASPLQAEQVHSEIRQFLAESNATVAKNISILYGGSVKAENAASLFAMPNIDGALVGGASLKAEEFINIVKAMSEEK